MSYVLCNVILFSSIVSALFVLFSGYDPGLKLQIEHIPQIQIDITHLVFQVTRCCHVYACVHCDGELKFVILLLHEYFNSV